jgi:flagellar protein FlaJ
LVIVLLLISLVGADVLPVIYATVYVGIPGLLVFMLLLIGRLSRGYGDTEVRPSLQAVESFPHANLDDGDDRLDRYQSRRRIVALRSLLTRPLAYIDRQPLRTLTFSVPLAVVTAVVFAGVDIATPTLAALKARPVLTTTAFFIVPGLVAIVPLTIVHERRSRREKRILERFPDFLHQLSSANEMGLTVSEALDLVARRSQGDLADEVRKAANDSYWSGDFADSLGRLADRIGNAQAARTLTLVETASRVSGDIHRVLDVAARDASNAARLRRERLQEMQAYTVIVAISFAIYLFIVILLDITFLSTFADLSARLPEQTESPIQFSRVDPATYRMILFHSALVQAAGNGLIAGKMGADSILSGLKYSIGLTLLTVVVYVGVVGL